MKDYSDLISRRFPKDDTLEFYAKPSLPAGKVGKALSAYTRIQPNQVLALHIYGNMFSGGVICFTATHCYHPKGSFALEDLNASELKEDQVLVSVNQGGSSTGGLLKAENEQAARLLHGFLQDIIFEPKGDQILEEVKADYSKYSPEAVNWLELRDEVMRTIDLLYQRFNDGKLSLLEYESKKADLLGRL